MIMMEYVTIERKNCVLKVRNKQKVINEKIYNTINNITIKYTYGK